MTLVSDLIAARTHTPGGDGCYCTHHPDDPAHGAACYLPPEPTAGFAPCPACFESSGYVWEHGNDWESGPWSHQTNIPCRECNGTGLVEAEVRSLEDMEADRDA